MTKGNGTEIINEDDDEFDPSDDIMSEFSAAVVKAAKNERINDIDDDSPDLAAEIGAEAVRFVADQADKAAKINRGTIADLAGQKARV